MQWQISSQEAIINVFIDSTFVNVQKYLLTKERAQASISTWDKLSARRVNSLLKLMEKNLYRINR